MSTTREPCIDEKQRQYIEGFEAGEAHTLFWIQRWYREGYSLHQIIEKLEGGIVPWWKD
jgi:hypothetical protein